MCELPTSPFVPLQITVPLPFEVDMVFETGMFSAALSISGERLTTALQDKRSQFDQRFEETFDLKAKVSINQMDWQ